MNDLSEFDAMLADLRRLHEDLSDATDFFAKHEERYLALSRKVAVQTLLALRPEGVDGAQWREDVTEFSLLVFSHSIPGGLEILYAGRTEDRRDEQGGRTTFTAISYESVLEWVNAGPENGGKDVTAIENTRNRAPEQIAYDVLTAINQHRLGIEKKDYGAIAGRLEEWVNSRVLSGDIEALLEAVLEAWYAALGPVVARDFEKWVGGKL